MHGLQSDRVMTSTSNELGVVAVISNESVSGPGRQLGALAVAMRARGASFRVVILHRRGNPRPEYADYLDGLCVPCEMIEDRGPLDVRGIVKRLSKRLDDWRPDVIQTHGYKATAVGWLLRRTQSRLPWIGFFHGETSENLKARFYHRLDHAMLAAADRVVVMSRLQHERFAQLGDRALIIHNAVLPDPGSAGEDDSESLAAAVAALPRPILGVVGRLSREKGVDIFLHACAALAMEGMVFSAIIAGDGPDHGALEAQSRQLGIEDRVIFLGTVRRIADLYGHLDLLVIPSRSEGLPNVLLEALGADVPVVATRVGAIPEVLTDPRAGIIVPAGQPLSLAAAVAPALDLGLSEEGRIARAAVVAKFSVERRVQAHIALYGELAGRGSTRE